jgi:hypothetical protein
MTKDIIEQGVPFQIENQSDVYLFQPTFSDSILLKNGHYYCSVSEITDTDIHCYSYLFSERVTVNVPISDCVIYYLP